MELHMPEGFVWGRPLSLTDGGAHRRYTLTGDGYALGRRLHIRDLADREAVYVRQRTPSLTPAFEVEVYGKPVGTLEKDLTAAAPGYVVEPQGWTLAGSPGLRDYRLLDGAETLAVCRPEAGGWLLTLPEGPEGLAALGVMAAVNCVLAEQSPRR